MKISFYNYEILHINYQWLSKIDIISIPFLKYKDTSLYNKVKYAPSIIIVDRGKVISYLDANNNSDTIKYQDENEFEKWLNNYIYLSK